MAKRERLLMDFGWRFHRGDVPLGRVNWGWIKAGDFNQGGSDPKLDDSGWREVDLPHDFVVEGTFTESAQELGTGHSIAAMDSIRNLHVAHGSLPVGIAWYRKRFRIPKRDIGRRLRLEFDGVFRDCEVYLNGHFAGSNRSGYIGFGCDITDIVNYGEANVLAVRVNASEYEGWFYEGGGIYRHVWLVKTDSLHVAPCGVFVAADIHDSGATATVRTTVANRRTSGASCRIRSTVIAPNGNVVAEADAAADVPPVADAEIVQAIEIARPLLWSLERPRLYRLVTTLRDRGRVVDCVETAFGIRSLRFDPDKGFFLNGEPVKLKGVCCHQDHAGVGAALPDRIHEFRIERLKEMGCNAYRTAHNPPAPELLDACDRLGMLVMDETRLMGSSDEILGQLERMVRRDRNHPSVILWSIGNEEGRVQRTEVGARIAASMKALVRKLDPTRPVTLAMNGGHFGPVAPVLDVMGFNYRPDRYDEYHRLHPGQPVLVSEAASTLCTRGVYENDPVKCYVSAYDVNCTKWGLCAEPMWKGVASRPFLAGTFVWTGFDYRGEPTPYSWPCVVSHFGIMDLCGFPKDNFYYYQAWWSGRTVLHLFPHWNWPGREGKIIDVWCHTNCDEVELLLNGHRLGRRKVRRNSHVSWKVRYRPGVLEAKGYRGGVEVATALVRTTGAAAGIRLIPDRSTIAADAEDVAIVRVEVTDAKGHVVPVADNDISFSVSGVGRIIGVGNGDPSSHEPEKAARRRAFGGLCQVIVQATRAPGPIRLGASSPGLAPAAVVIRAERREPRPWLPPV